MTETTSTFRDRVTAWLDANAPRRGGPGDFSAAHLVSAETPEQYHQREQEALAITKSWQRRVFDAGFAGRSWPGRYGGLDQPRWQDEIFMEEQARYGVSTKMIAIALEMVPPVLFGYGTEEQRAEHLPRVLRGDESWCQLLSEPGAGSDLAGVSTHAAPASDGWSVSGQKVWTSGAGTADFALLLARSEATPGRDGLSCFALDMRSSGVEVRPLRQMSGAYHFNEVFLDDVFVPQHALIGAPGEGWAVLRTMLASERAAIGGGTSGRSAGQLVALAQRLGRSDDALVRQVVVTAYGRERVLDLLQARVSADAGVPAGGSVTKLLYSEHARKTANDALYVLGLAGTTPDHPEAGPWVDRLLFAPGLRMGGGTDEIQRNTIAERGLGLPREIRS
jgi:alkylation response protein AidB-like acyl-CoA dehydrogenase